MSAGDFLSGLLGGYQAGQALQDQKQLRRMREIKIREEEENERARAAEKDIDRRAAALVRQAGVSAPDSQPPAQPPGNIAASIGAGHLPPEQDSGQQAAPPASAVPPAAPQAAQTPDAVPSAAPQAAQTPEMGQPSDQIQTLPNVTVKARRDAIPSESEDFYQKRIQLAMEDGHANLANKYTKEYADFLAKRQDIEDRKFYHGLRPVMEEVQRLHAAGKVKEAEDMLQKMELAIAERTEQGVVTGWSMIQNPLTRGQGLAIIGKSLGLDGPLKDIVVEGEHLIPVGPDGKPVTGHDGRPMRVHKDAMARLIEKHKPKVPLIKLGPGDVAIDEKTGSVFAANPAEPKDASKREETISQQIKEVGSIIDRALGIYRDAFGNMATGVTPEQVRASAELHMRASELVRQGVPPPQAARIVLDEYARKRAMSAGKKPGEQKKIDLDKYIGQP